MCLLSTSYVRANFTLSTSCAATYPGYPTTRTATQTAATITRGNTSRLLAPDSHNTPCMPTLDPLSTCIVSRRVHSTQRDNQHKAYHYRTLLQRRALTFPQATERFPGMYSSGNTLSMYHWKGLQWSRSRSFFRSVRSPTFRPRASGRRL